jgi:hypothetical protein
MCKENGHIYGHGMPLNPYVEKVLPADIPAADSTSKISCRFHTCWSITSQTLPADIQPSPIMMVPVITMYIVAVSGKVIIPCSS